MPLNIAFAGTPAFAAVSLAALLASHHTVCAVYTQPDRPAGRGRQPMPSAVKKLAIEKGIPVFQPVSLALSDFMGTHCFEGSHLAQTLQPASLNAYGSDKPPTAADTKAKTRALDVMVVVAYGQLLPQAILDAPRYGCLNVHASILPRWRGAAPIERALEAGDKMTGITLMQMDAHLDTGDCLYQAHCPIQPNDTAQTLTERLAILGAEALLKTLHTIEKGTTRRTPQDHSAATYAHKITKQEGQLDWQLSATVLERKIRAFNPRPIAFTVLKGQCLRVWEAESLDNHTSAPPGTVLSANKIGIDVATGSGVLRLLTIQIPGGKPLKVNDFLKGHAFLCAMN